VTISAARLRPGPAAEAWLEAKVSELKGSDPLAPLTVIVPTNYAGLALRRRLAATGYANVRHTVLPRLAEALGGPSLAAQGRQPLTPVTQEAAIRAALRRAGGIGPQTEHRAVVGTLRALFDDLAESGLDEERVATLAERGELARVAIAAHREYRRLLDEGGFHDRADLCRAAVEALDSNGAELMADWGPVIVYLPTRLSAPELRLVAALGKAGVVELGLPWLDDPLADVEPGRWAESLAQDWPPPGLRPALPHGTAVGERVGDITLLVAPDAGEEVRAAVRMVLADLENGVPLHRTALVYRHPEPYQQLVKETLKAAGLEPVVLGGRPISESFAGRGLLGLLHLQGRFFARGAVLNWLSSLPHGGEGPSLAQWDRISRKAGVVRGVDQWRDRLRRKLEEDRATIEKLEKEDDESTEPRRSFLRSEAAATEQMAARIEEMDRRTWAPQVQDWTTLVRWALDLQDRYLKPKGWDKAQLEAADLVAETIAGLDAAAPLDGEITVERFVETLEDALASRKRPDGRLGQGVVTGSISSIAGMTFDHVYLLGMSERAYPARPAVDPIFPDDTGADPLGRADRRLAAEWMSYLAALSAGGSAVLCYPTHDTEQRDAYPARWLLDAATELAGRRVGPMELREPQEDQDWPWLTRLVSTEAALTRGPVMLNLPERRVNEAREIAAAKGDLLTSALALREELPLGRGLRASTARASTEFTVHDGNLEAVAAGLTKLAGGLARLHPISPSGVETWAACPFRYFLGRVLDVEPTERPEDDESWAISAIDRGSLIHAILEEFFLTLKAEGRPAPGETYTQADRDLMDRLAREHFARVEALGQTGYRLAWLNEQTAIQLDLRTVLSKDEEFRGQLTVRPEFFEQGFGWAEGWPAAEVRLADGAVVRLRGYIDRVDLGEGEAYVTDYKTGSNYSRKDFEEDPVVAGTKVQLAVYSNAVRRYLEAAGRTAGSVTASYWFISTKGKFARIEVSDPDAADQRLAEIMGVVNQGLIAGAFPQVPGEDQGGIPRRPAFSNCVFCDYNRICPTGRDQIHERKKDQPGAAMHQRLELR
jgi:ATP-dependent helicase/nuclease subunit B